MTWLADTDSEDYKVPWYIQVVRFICSSIFHFEFAPEIATGIKCMKFAVFNRDKFAHPN